VLLTSWLGNVLAGKRFATVDRMWRKTTDGAKRNPLVLKVCDVTQREDQVMLACYKPCGMFVRITYDISFLLCLLLLIQPSLASIKSPCSIPAASPQVCSNQKLLDQFVEANKLLESVQKGLADYLETKRLAFARFFFLSNDELLQVS
jgi:hypothetical protein